MVVTINYRMLILSEGHDVCMCISIVMESNGNLISGLEQKLIGIRCRKDEKNCAQSAVSRTILNFVRIFLVFCSFGLLLF